VVKALYNIKKKHDKKKSAVKQGGGEKVLKLSEDSKPIMKAKPPKKKATIEANKAARLALAGGDVIKDELKRKTDQDARTLYIRFNVEKKPTTAEDIKGLHSDIKFVRTPRVAYKGQNGIAYAFIEFGNEEECKSAKNKLSTTQYKGKELYVDFVGEKSKNKKKSGNNKELNPTRLFVCGLAPGVSKSNLQEMFPKACQACIPSNSKKKGTSFGFVQFSTPADAKAAFDAAQDLTINNHKITVLFAKKSDMKDEVLKKKAEKRKQKRDEKKAKKLKVDKTAPDKVDIKEKVDIKVKVEDDEEEDDDDDDEEEDDENDKTIEQVKNENKDAVNDNDEEDDDDEDDEDDDDDDDDEDDEDDEEEEEEKNDDQDEDNDQDAEDEQNDDQDDDDDEEEEEEDDDDDEEDEEDEDDE